MIVAALRGLLYRGEMKLKQSPLCMYVRKKYCSCPHSFGPATQPSSRARKLGRSVVSLRGSPVSGETGTAPRSHSSCFLAHYLFKAQFEKLSYLLR